MNAENTKVLDSDISFKLMNEIETADSLSQRELAKRLGIAVGLVNSYMKNLVAKGFIRVKNFPRNRYSYLLTPQGIAEKSRLAYQHLSYFTNLYTVVRQDYLNLFRRMEASGVKEVIFCGVDEVAEIAYLSLNETGIKLVAVLDDERQGELYFGFPVKGLVEKVDETEHPVVITSLKRRNELLQLIHELGVTDSAVFVAGGC